MCLGGGSVAAADIDAHVCRPRTGGEEDDDATAELILSLPAGSTSATGLGSAPTPYKQRPIILGRGRHDLRGSGRNDGGASPLTPRPASGGTTGGGLAPTGHG